MARKNQEEEVVLEPIQEEKEPQPAKHIVFIPSNKVAYQAETKNGKTTKFLQGAVNGKKFKVVCDIQQEISDDVFEALKPLLSKLGK